MRRKDVRAAAMQSINPLETIAVALIAALVVVTVGILAHTRNLCTRE